jgi:cytochrome c oxidase assembly factor CtaG
MSTRILAVELAVVVLAYGLAVLRLPEPSGARPVAFLAGIVAVAVALVSPLHGVAERSLAGHMVAGRWPSPRRHSAGAPRVPCRGAG